MSSPLSKFATEIQPTSGIVKSFTTATPVSPLATVPSTPSSPNQPITDEQIDNLGADILNQIGTTTEKIISTVALQQFNELGDIMSRIQVVHSSLDPAQIERDLQPTGVQRALRWIKGTVIDIKAELTKRLSTASSSFDTIIKDIESHITKHNRWVADLESLYNENYTHHTNLSSVIDKAKSLESYQTQYIQSLPTIDPNSSNAMMLGQQLRDAQTTLNSIQIRLDNLIRRRIVVENNAPLIRSKQQTSRQTVRSLKEVLDIIPDMKMQFVLYKQSIESQDSLEFHNTLKAMVNQTIQQGATTANQTAIQAATTLNSSVITNDTLTHIRTQMIDSLTRVRSIEQAAKEQRAKDLISNDQQQQQYLQTLTDKGAI